MDDENVAAYDEDMTDAALYAELFPAVYLRFHRRDGKARELPAASRGVLQHLSLTGPLTIGELSTHLDRVQSATSEIVDHLEADGLLERMRDPRDKRRVLVWLTDEGQARLARERQVLSVELLERAMALLEPHEREALLTGTRALLRAAHALSDSHPSIDHTEPKGTP
jgi:DNA-binding MarR family transcriptional regulator